MRARRTHDEIARLRADADAVLRESKRAAHLAELAEKRVGALQTALAAHEECRAFELGLEPGDVPTADLCTNEDERVLWRLLAAWTLAANRPALRRADTLEHAIAWVAIDQDWSAIDAARAILNDGDSKVDELRSTSPHMKARRVRKMMRELVQSQIEWLDAHINAINVGRARDAAGVALVAVLGVTFGLPGPSPSIDDVRRRLLEARKGLKVKLARLG
jgi:hypothetical protein